jgi:hypothetical protein
LVLVQLKVTVPPAFTEVLSEVRVTVGAGGAVETFNA